MLRPFHSNIIKSINSYISHTNIHTISFTPTTLVTYVGLYPNLMSSLYSLSISVIFPLYLSLPYFLYVFSFAIFPFYLFFYHIVNSVQPFPSSIGDQIWSWTTQSSYLIKVKVLQSVDVDRMNINLPKLHEDNHLKQRTKPITTLPENFENIHQNCWKVTIIVLGKIWWKKFAFKI